MPDDINDILDAVREAETAALWAELTARCAGRHDEADAAWDDYMGLGRVRAALADLERLERGWTGWLAALVDLKGLEAADA
jgi:hypothetical protein